MPASPTRLPDFPASLRFLDRPPLVASTALAGQVVAVLFWRCGCVHSRQALTELSRLAGAFADQPVAVLAVHVPTVAAEHDEDRVRRVCAPARDTVTVALDPKRAFCKAAGITALPSLLLVDTKGEIRFTGIGEPNSQRLHEAIDGLLVTSDGSAEAVTFPLVPVAPRPSQRLGICALASDEELLWVAASERGRVYAIGDNHEIEHEFAGFQLPAGLYAHDGRMFVSDCSTHELCAIDPYAADVTTVLGTGHRGTDRFGGGFGEMQPLCSPTGITGQDGALYFAHAGAHQIWQFDPDTQAASAWIGTGQRSRLDGDEQATFAEPLAVAAADYEMFVADAGNDALRVIELGHNSVSTIAEDLQRPAAVALRGDEVFVAASWQPAIVRMTRTGSDREVVCDQQHGLVEPVALAFHQGELWVADVGADALFAIDVNATPPTVRRVELGVGESDEPRPRTGAAQLAQSVEVLEFSDVTLRIHLPVKAGEELDPSVACEVDVVDEGERLLAADRHDTANIDGEHVPVLVPIEDRGAGVLRIRVRAMVKVATDASPVKRDYLYVVPVTAAVAGELEVEVHAC